MSRRPLAQGQDPGFRPPPHLPRFPLVFAHQVCCTTRTQAPSIQGEGGLLRTLLHKQPRTPKRSNEPPWLPLPHHLRLPIWSVLPPQPLSLCIILQAQQICAPLPPSL